MDKKTLHLLILEDNPDDAELEILELKREGFALKWNVVDTEQHSILKKHWWKDPILSSLIIKFLLSAAWRLYR